MNILSEECIRAKQCEHDDVTIEAPILALQTMNIHAESDTQEKRSGNNGSNHSSTNERIDYLYTGLPAKMMNRVSSTTPNQLQKSVRTDNFTFDKKTYSSRSSSVPSSLRHDFFDSNESRHSVSPKQSELIMLNNHSQSKSPSHIVSSAAFDRLYNSHTAVSVQNREDSPSPRSRSTRDPFFDLVTSVGQGEVSSKTGSTSGTPPTSPSRVVSSAVYDRLYNTHTEVSDQKRKQSPSPRSRSTRVPFYNGIRGDFRNHMGSTADSIGGNPPTSPSRVVSSAVYDRLYSIHTEVSDQKRKQSPSPRSRSTRIPFYNGIRGDFRKYLKTQEQAVRSPDRFSSKVQSPRVRSNSRNISNMSSNVRSSSVPTSMSSAFDRLHLSPTKVSKAKEEYRQQCRERIAKIIKMREMSRNGECRKDYGTIPSSRACDMYYRGMADLVKKEIQVAKHSKTFETKLTVDQLVRYSKYILKQKEEANIKNDK